MDYLPWLNLGCECVSSSTFFFLVGKPLVIAKAYNQQLTSGNRHQIINSAIRNTKNAEGFLFVFVLFVCCCKYNQRELNLCENCYVVWERWAPLDLINRGSDFMR